MFTGVYCSNKHGFLSFFSHFPKRLHPKHRRLFLFEMPVDRLAMGISHANMKVDAISSVTFTGMSENVGYIPNEIAI